MSNSNKLVNSSNNVRATREYRGSWSENEPSTNRLLAFIGAWGFRTSILHSLEEAREVASEMFAVRNTGTLLEFVKSIDAVGTKSRRMAVRAYVAAKHPIPDEAFPIDCLARGTLPAAAFIDRYGKVPIRLGEVPDHAMTRGARVVLEGAADLILRKAGHPAPEITEAPKPIKRAKLRHQLNRLAERKMKAGEQLTREEAKEVERRVRQRASRREKAARRNAQAVAKP